MARYRNTRPAPQADLPAVQPTKSKKRVTLHRAKVLTEQQFNRALAIATDYEDEVVRLRNEALLRLSFYCGLRIGEIGGLQWRKHVLDADGEVLDEVRITPDITKAGGARTLERSIPLEPILREVLAALRDLRRDDVYVIFPLDEPRHYVNGWETRSANGSSDANTLAQFVRRLYLRAGLDGASSHSGRRTFGTMLARKASLVGASIVDVQRLMGHASLESTQEYVESTPQQHRLVAHVFADVKQAA